MSIHIMHTYAYDLGERCIDMRTTLNIEDKLIEEASELTGVKEKTTLVRLGLEALIARESARRLAKLGGTEKQLKAVPRRRVAEH
jgi:Arc/MetJ family transcription regulator